MAVNNFFQSNFNSTLKDQALLQSLNTESIQINGIDSIYLPREYVNLDELFGEDQSSAFKDSYIIETFVKNVDSFGGDGKFLSKFGLEIRDEMTLLVSKTRFKQIVSTHNNEIPKPREGDLIWLQPSIDQRSRAFEISYVSSEEPFYQLGNTYVYELRCKVFEMSGETFETGIESIDDIESSNEIKTTITLSNGSGGFVVNETVTFDNWPNTSATVVSHSGNTLVISDLRGDLPTSGSVIGEHASYEITETIPISNKDNLTYSDNEFLDSLDFVDFTEANPFSESD